MEIETIFQRLHIVNGSNFLAVENLHILSLEEAALILPYLHEKATLVHQMIIMANKDFDTLLQAHGFHVHDERILVKKELNSLPQKDLSFSYHPLHAANQKNFLQYWQECIDSSLNPASASDAAAQFESMRTELGSSYQHSGLIAYEGREPIGIIMPHLEPGRADEGRFFYIGMLPKYQGTGRSKLLHADGLQLLKNHFQASYYLGSTSKQNIPMIRTFLSNKCEVIEEHITYKKEWTL